MRPLTSAVLAGAALSVCAQVVTLPGPPPLALPGWLAPFPQTTDYVKQATTGEVTSSYLAAASAADVIAHYEKQLRAAGIDFAPRPEESGSLIQAETAQAYCTVAVRPQNGGVRVEVSYKAGRRPVPPVLTELLLEWPSWLEVPNARLVSQRTNPRGRVPEWSVESCPGDVISQPSHGCLKKEYLSSRPMPEVYDYLVFLLHRYGYTSESVSKAPYANLQLWKRINGQLAQMRMRQYPEQTEESYYRQLDVQIGQPANAGTKVEVTFTVSNPAGTVPVPSVAGTWSFTHFNDRFRGTVALSQSGTAVAGTWHTSFGKVEPDDAVAGRIEGNMLYLRRTIGDVRQDYQLTISPDNSRMDGYGEGFFLNHTNLNMQRVAAQ